MKREELNPARLKLVESHHKVPNASCEAVELEAGDDIQLLPIARIRVISCASEVAT